MYHCVKSANVTLMISLFCTCLIRGVLVTPVCKNTETDKHKHIQACMFV